MMRLGEESFDDIEILHTLACDSMTWDNNSYLNTWRMVFDGIHQVDGFHGSSYALSLMSDPYGDLGADGFSSAVGVEWVTELYQNERYEDAFGDKWDNCPVSYSGRATSSGATYLLTNEEYDTIADYSEIANPSGWSRIWMSGCQAHGGVQELP